MEENKKAYKRVAVRKLLFKVSLVYVFILVLFLIYLFLSHSTTNAVLLAGMIPCMIAAEVLGIKIDQKRLDKLGGISAEEKEKSDIELKETVRKVIIVSGVLAVILVAIFSVKTIFSSLFKDGGDGINTCRNCGRETSLVSGFGFCGNCYEGFVDWQENNWTED